MPSALDEIVQLLQDPIPPLDAQIQREAHRGFHRAGGKTRAYVHRLYEPCPWCTGIEGVRTAVKDTLGDFTAAVSGLADRTASPQL